MRPDEIAVMLCVLGIGSMVSFAQTSRYFTVGPYSNFLSMLLIPAAISLLWRLALQAGWWTILIFLVVSFSVGALNGIFIRRFGRELLYSMQPILGTIFVFCAATAWIANDW